MPTDNSKALEIKRLTTPLTFDKLNAYDSEGNIINCIETINEVGYVIEPKEGILSDDEILKYAPKSKAASRVRLKNGFGNLSDALLIHDNLIWISALYYVILLCCSVVMMSTGNKYGMLLILILAIIPLIYMYRVFNLNNYLGSNAKRQEKPKSDNVEKTGAIHDSIDVDMGVPSLKRYENEINNLKVLFDIKEGVVRDLIKKRFAPPQITYDRFIAIIDSSHKMFYNQADAATNIIHLAAEDTPRVQGEINNKIDAMQKIIDYIENLTNELVINISNETGSSEEVKNLLNDMENLIDSVKEY